jgi:hypothetical protein
VHKLVVNPRRVIVIRREPQVALVKVPNLEWLPAGHHHPLSNVELLIQNDEWVLDVLLNDPDLVLCRGSNGIDYVLVLGVDGDPAAPGFASRL